MANLFPKVGSPVVLVLFQVAPASVEQKNAQSFSLPVRDLEESTWMAKTETLPTHI